uniref:Thyroglobulin type-1 domain-containing protein n=1 Tax=Acrobeloides nanus TaxID=290746 RepID=A0A914DR00_9BILA
MCRTSFECFPDEKCVDGFCCPYMTFTSPAPTLEAASDPPETTNTLSCPDGTGWLRLCKIDADCIFNDEICANGKCCGSCRQRRLQVLRELQNFISIYGAYVPQCSGEGLYYHEKQCMSGTNECWCVTKYGERIAPSLAKAADELDCEEMVRNFTTPRSPQKGPTTTSKPVTEFNVETDEVEETERATTSTRRTTTATPTTKKSDTFETSTPDKKVVEEFLNDDIDCGQTEEVSYCHYSKCQASCEDPTKTSCEDPTKSLCPAKKCVDGCHCRSGYIRRTDDPKSECILIEDCNKPNTTDVLRQEIQDFICNDPLKQYTYCGSPCPMSCETRLDTACVFDHCVRGCFCRTPYILESNRDPLKSKCVLPAQCPLMKDIFRTAYQEEPSRSNFDTLLNNNFFGNPLTTTITLHRCPDPLKNYLRCGSECPPACNQVKHNCSLSCVAGCFCRTPYILKDINDVNSQCILPQHCSSKPQGALETVKDCRDPRKIWTTCFSKKCVRTCTQWQPFCSPTDCQPGCECRPPYVMKDLNDPESPCILSDECPQPEVIPTSKCRDPLKEFHSCASSCPLACDNLQPQVCTPCISGCFCKNGYILESSKNWAESKCVRINQCAQQLPSPQQTKKNIEAPQKPTQHVPLKPEEEEEEEGKKEEHENQRPNLIQNEALQPQLQPDLVANPQDKSQNVSETDEGFSMIEQDRTSPILLVPSYCPPTPRDRGGRSCLSDFDCGFQQRCCNVSAGSIFPDPPRCTCLDPNAIWVECGTLCPEYCGQASVPKCSPTCNPGCNCAPGYVKARNDLVAPCVPKTECTKLTKSRNLLFFTTSSTESIKTTTTTYEHLRREQGAHQDNKYAGAELYHKDGSLLGKFVFVKLNGQFQLKGKIYNLPKDSLDFALDLHQFGDSVISGCRHIGWSIGINGNSSSTDDAYSHNWLRIHVEPDAFDKAREVERTLDQEDFNNYQAIIGRSLVLHRLVKNNETGQFLTGEPVSCATIGFYQI